MALLPAHFAPARLLHSLLVSVLMLGITVSPIPMPPAAAAPSPAPSPAKTLGEDAPRRVIVQTYGAPLAEQYAPAQFNSLPARSQSTLLAEQRAQVWNAIQHARIAPSGLREFSGVAFNGFAMTVSAAEAERLSKLAGVERVYADAEVRLSLAESVPQIGADQVWAQLDGSGSAVTGSGVIVAVLDSGIDYTHPDLGGCIGPACKVIGGYDFFNNDPDPMDDNNHGTHVAGIIAAQGSEVTGVAPGASLLAYKVVDATGSGWSSLVISAIEAAVTSGADVINMSLGSPCMDPALEPMALAVESAASAGVLSVSSAGNEGPGMQTLLSPGCAASGLSVAAATKADELAGFSSRGPLITTAADAKPDVTAPGVYIYSTMPVVDGVAQYAEQSGTSMASPHAAGAAALLKQLHPSWGPGQVKAALITTAQDIGHTGYEQGSGRIDVRKAAAQPVTVLPGKLNFGVPVLDGAASRTVQVTNTSAGPLTVQASTTLRRVTAGRDSAMVPEAMPAGWASLNSSEFTLLAGQAQAVELSLHIGPDAATGLYEGILSLNITGGASPASARVPFSFWAMSHLSLAVTDTNDTPLSLGIGTLYTLYDLDRDRFLPLIGDAQQSTFTALLEEGHYQAYMMFNLRGYYYEAIGNPYDWDTRTYFLVKDLQVAPNQPLQATLSAADTHPITLDLRSRSGLPLELSRLNVSFQTSTPGGLKNTLNVELDSELRIDANGLYASWPTSYPLYFSNTPPGVRVLLAGLGSGFSPPLSAFVQENWQSLAYLNNGSPQMETRRWMDEAYPFFETLQDIHAPRTIPAYLPGQARTYHVRYDYPGPVQKGYGFSNSFDATGYESMVLPLAADFTVYSPVEVSAGTQRTIYARAPFRLMYNPGGGDHEFGLEDILPDSTSTLDEPLEYSQWVRRYRISLADLQVNPAAPPAEVRLGSRIPFPSLRMDNDAATIRVLGPFRSALEGNYVSGAFPPTVDLYRDGQYIEAATWQGWMLPPYSNWTPATGGVYDIFVNFPTSGGGDWVNAYHMTAQAHFSLPASDPNPPYLESLDVPPSFRPNQPFPVLIQAADAQSSLAAVQLETSLDGGAWQAAPLQQSGDEYTAQVDPAGSDRVSLRIQLEDAAGNQFTATIHSAVRAEVPARLAIQLDHQTAGLCGAPEVFHISGSLTRPDDSPLHDQAVFPIRILAGDTLVGYLRDAKLLPDGSLQHGLIDTDWHFTPQSVTSTPGPLNLRFVFDLSGYQAQSVEVPINVTGCIETYLPVLAR